MTNNKKFALTGKKVKLIGYSKSFQKQNLSLYFLISKPIIPLSNHNLAGIKIRMFIDKVILVNKISKARQI
jgi:hypothetical protein